MSGDGWVRTEYADGQVLRARDLSRDQAYASGRWREHLSLAHDPGILFGLRMSGFKRGATDPVLEAAFATGTHGTDPLDIYMEAGIAVDALGRVVAVQRRIHLGPDLEPRDAGTYRVELLYQSGSQSASAPEECSAAAGGVLSDGASLRLRPISEALPKIPPAVGLDPNAVFTIPEAPVVIGQVVWDGLGAFVEYASTGRVYAGAVGQRLRSPDNEAEIALVDANGRIAIRTAPEAPPPGAADPFLPGPMEDRVRVDTDGSVWVQAEVRVGPEGVVFRPEEASGSTNWSAGIVKPSGGAGEERGAGFAKNADGQPDWDAYHKGQYELRVLFEREGAGENGLRRVVIGHVDRDGLDFKPAVVVYDKAPAVPEDGHATVEVWGDMYVRGTAWLNRVSKIPNEPGAEFDELDMLLRQLAGPLDQVFRAFLVSDPVWLHDLGQAATPHIVNDANLINQVVAAAVPPAAAAATAPAAAAAAPIARAGVENSLQTNPGLTAAVLLALSATPNAADFEAGVTALFKRMKDETGVLNIQGWIDTL